MIYTKYVCVYNAHVAAGGGRRASDVAAASSSSASRENGGSTNKSSFTVGVVIPCGGNIDVSEVWVCSQTPKKCPDASNAEKKKEICMYMYVAVRCVTCCDSRHQWFGWTWNYLGRLAQMRSHCSSQIPQSRSSAFVCIYISTYMYQ